MLHENSSTVFKINVSIIIIFIGLTNSKMGFNSYLGNGQMEKITQIFLKRLASLTSNRKMSGNLIS